MRLQNTDPITRTNVSQVRFCRTTDNNLILWGWILCFSHHTAVFMFWFWRGDIMLKALNTCFCHHHHDFSLNVSRPWSPQTRLEMSAGVFKNIQLCDWSWGRLLDVRENTTWDWKMESHVTWWPDEHHWSYYNISLNADCVFLTLHLSFVWWYSRCRSLYATHSELLWIKAQTGWHGRAERGLMEGLLRLQPELEARWAANTTTFQLWVLKRCQ